MDSERWERIQAIFHEALASSAEAREEWLRAACGEDALLLSQVQEMLAEDDSRGSLLDREFSEVAYAVVSDWEEWEPSQEFGPYRLIRILGQGGMGVVWLAERADFSSQVAIKFLPHAGLSPSRRERFVQEIRTNAKLTHPYIARLYDAGTLPDGAPWFVMEYVQGIRLTEYCREPGRGVEEQLRLFRLVCEAVQYAHSQAIIHRDLKPSNILVEADGTPKLLDFGIARELEQLDAMGSASGDTTLPGPRFMSLDYAAPEWVRDGVVGFSTDVYSLGVILYEILSGRHPFRDQTSASEESRRSREAKKPSLVAGSIEGISKSAWSELDLLCLTAMHEDPMQRYRSVEALIRDVEHYLKREPLEARPDSLGYRMRKFVERNRTAVVAATVVFLIVVSMTVLFTVRLAKARDSALAEAARTQRIQRFMVYLLGGSEKGAAPASDLRVVNLLDAGVKEADALSVDPETQGELYENLGNMYDKLGEFAKAERLLMLALESKKKAAVRDDAKVAATLVQIGIVKADESQFQEAEKYVQQGLELASRHLAPGDPKIFAARAALGKVVGEAGDFQRAIAILTPLVQRKPVNDEDEYTLSASLADLTAAEYSVGNSDLSDAYGLRALELDRRLYGKNHPKIAEDLQNLGENKAAVSLNAQAENYYRQAEAILLAWYGPAHPDLAAFRGVLARTLVDEGKDREAAAMIDEVLRVEERAYGPVDGRLAMALDTRGGIAMRRGDLAQAERDFSRAVEIDRKLYGEGNYQTAVLLADLGEVYSRGGQYNRAEVTTRGAVKTLLQTIPTDAINTAWARKTWGHALVAQKRYQEAEAPLVAAWDVFAGQRHPLMTDVKSVSEDLMTTYAALHDDDKSKILRMKLMSLGSRAPTPSK